MKVLNTKIGHVELVGVLERLLLVRIAVLSVVLGAATWDLVQSEFPDGEGQLIFSAIATTYILSLINILWLKKTGRILAVGVFQITSDVLLSTLAASITGNAVSLGLYVLTVLGSSVAFRKHGAIATAIFSAIIYTLNAYGYISFLASDVNNIKTKELFSVYLVLLAVALSTKYLRKQLDTLLNTVRAQEAALTNLTESKNRLTLEVNEMEERLQLHEQVNAMLSDDSTSEATLLDDAPHIVAESPQMKDVIILAKKAAPVDSHILITGARGTGKEMIARYIHQRSNRKDEPFVTVDCAAIPELMLEAELFGQKKGAGSGNNTDKIGYIKQANGGTLFLDRIENIPLPLQGKLLRAIQDHTARANGDSKEYAADVRVIATNSKNLSIEVSENRFRDDLFYRISVVHIEIPALKHRRADLPALIKNIVTKLSQSDSLPSVSPEALNYLYNYNYPGNITELETIIERALVLCSDNIRLEHISPKNTGDVIKGDANGISTTPTNPTEIIILPASLESILEDIEKRYLVSALENSNGLKKNAAELLGLNFRSFRYRLKKYQMDSDSSEN